ncbi:MAG: fructosamine kinase family protein [Phycisphaerales bacterium]|nr:fructosamine kinase family protein [Phycisphaerales bacterium]
MIDDRRILDALRAAGITEPPVAAPPLGGGCIHEVRRVDFDTRPSLVAKIGTGARAGMILEEARSLDALRTTATVPVPDRIGLHRTPDAAVLLLDCLRPGPPDPDAWRAFGVRLAALHRADGPGRYGFDTDNHLGTTPQPNAWSDDWVEFNAQCRLEPQIRRARDAGLLDAGAAARLDLVVDALHRLVPRRPRASLLHGDLWSGNALTILTDDGPSVAVIDPACSYGDGWADIAMMRLFGGFPASCLDAYADAIDDHDDLDARLAVYRLYHVLNHVNLFGRGYVGSAMDLAARLV